MDNKSKNSKNSPKKENKNNKNSPKIPWHATCATAVRHVDPPDSETGMGGHPPRRY